jgi:hypothetical protein
VHHSQLEGGDRNNRRDCQGKKQINCATQKNRHEEMRKSNRGICHHQRRPNSGDPAHRHRRELQMARQALKLDDLVLDDVGED